MKPVTERRRKKITAPKPMRACHRRRNSRKSSFGDTMLLAALAVEIEGESRHAFHRADRQGRTHDAVDVAVQPVALPELRLLELLQERGIADFLPAAFAIDEHAHVVDVPADHDEPRSNWLFLARLLENPHALAVVAPVALPQLRGGMAQYRAGLRLYVLGQPEHLGRWIGAEHLCDEGIRLLVDVSASGHYRCAKAKRHRKQRMPMASARCHQNM